CRHEIKLQALVVGLHNQLFAIGVDIGRAHQKHIVYAQSGDLLEVTAELSDFLGFATLLDFVVIFDRIDAVKGLVVSEASLYSGQVIVVPDQSDALAPTETPRQYGVDIGER